VLYAPSGRLRAPWRLALYLLALVSGLYVASAFTPLLYAAGRLVTPRPSLEPWVQLLAAALAHLLCLRIVERRPWADVRLGRAALGARPVAFGAGLGALAVAVPTGLLLAAGAFRVTPGSAGSSLAAGAALLGALAPAALFEELLVRGYPFLVLRESVGAAPALLGTSAVFGALHATNPGATVWSCLVVALAGVFLGGVLLATGSLWAAFAAHLAWNWTLAGGFHALVSGLAFVAPDYRVVDAGPDWLTGGAWGPEGGAGAVAGMLAALAVLLRRARRADPSSPTPVRVDRD
jgi:membrane protease YdiL (CAAX protease family)